MTVVNAVLLAKNLPLLERVNGICHGLFAAAASHFLDDASRYLRGGCKKLGGIAQHAVHPLPWRVAGAQPPGGVCA